MIEGGGVVSGVVGKGGSVPSLPEVKEPPSKNVLVFRPSRCKFSTDDWSRKVDAAAQVKRTRTALIFPAVHPRCQIRGRMYADSYSPAAPADPARVVAKSAFGRSSTETRSKSRATNAQSLLSKAPSSASRRRAPGSRDPRQSAAAAARAHGSAPDRVPSAAVRRLRACLSVPFRLATHR
jgi:hypothetical protein